MKFILKRYVNHGTKYELWKHIYHLNDYIKFRNIKIQCPLCNKKYHHSHMRKHKTRIMNTKILHLYNNYYNLIVRYKLGKLFNKHNNTPYDIKQLIILYSIINI
jgi:hypothetical protein